MHCFYLLANIFLSSRIKKQEDFLRPSIFPQHHEHHGNQFPIIFMQIQLLLNYFSLFLHEITPYFLGEQGFRTENV